MTSQQISSLVTMMPCYVQEANSPEMGCCPQNLKVLLPLQTTCQTWGRMMKKTGR